MTKKAVRVLVTALAEQQYMLTILATKLVELGLLKPGELKDRFDASPEKQEFLRDYVQRLIAILGSDLGPNP